VTLRNQVTVIRSAVGDLQVEKGSGLKTLRRVLDEAQQKGGPGGLTFAKDRQKAARKLQGGESDKKTTGR
jgi:hypothetical protein